MDFISKQFTGGPFLRVRLIPKSMAPIVSISLIEPPLFEGRISESGNFQVVHIDDSEDMRGYWVRRAKSKGIALLSLSSSKGLTEELPSIGPECKLYIDQNLGETEVKGEEIAKG